MALAKYLEDIADRYFESTAAAERLEEAFRPGTYEPTQQPSTGWVRLAMDSGPLPDRIALVMGDIPSFQVETDLVPAPFKLSFVSSPGGESPEILMEECRASFQLDRPGLYLLRATCGAYFRDYHLDVTRTLDLDQEAPIEESELYMQDRPDEWNRPMLDSLGLRLRAIMHERELPESFCNGVLDYHLGLWHGEHGERMISHRRFEDAYRNLRPFVSHSRFANLACDYILYLTNRFSGFDPTRRSRGLSGLLDFFSCPFGEEKIPDQADSSSTSKRQVQIFINSVDSRIIDLVGRITSGKLDGLERALNSLENQIHFITKDLPSITKVHLTLARGFRSLGFRENAARHYKSLQQVSLAEPWMDEINEYLSHKS